MSKLILLDLARGTEPGRSEGGNVFSLYEKVERKRVLQCSTQTENIFQSCTQTETIR